MRDLKTTIFIRTKQMLVAVMVIFCCAATIPAMAGDAGESGIPEVPVPDMVTMLDLGADKCVPCKMMAPILKELKEKYRGRAAIVFIDVWKHREQAQRFGIRGIPTQIFFDRDGNEVGRHVGYMDKKSIVNKLEELGVPLQADPEEDAQ